MVEQIPEGSGRPPSEGLDMLHDHVRVDGGLLVTAREGLRGHERREALRPRDGAGEVVFEDAEVGLDVEVAAAEVVGGDEQLLDGGEHKEDGLFGGEAVLVIQEADPALVELGSQLVPIPLLHDRVLS